MAAEYTCDRAAEWLPSDRTVGRQWQWRCMTPDGSSTLNSTATVAGIEDVAIGGEQVRAVHIRIENALAGANEGRQTIGWWCHYSTGLPVRITSDTDMNGATPIGRVRYREQVTLELQSLTPRT